MKNSRLSKYLSQKTTKQTSPITTKEEVSNNPDHKIDQDFPGFPGGQAKEGVIKPETATEKKTAAVNVKDGEKREKGKTKKADEQDSDGSAGAFGGTEEVKD